MASHIGAPSNSKNYHKKVGAMNFAQAVADSLTQYTTEVEDAISDEVIEMGKESVRELSQVLDPVATTSGTAKPMPNRSWKKYSSSWQGEIDKKENYTRVTVHNKKYYRLTHLLEFGHATRNGTTTRAFSHILPVADKYSQKLLDNTKKIIEKGGKLWQLKN